MSTDAINEPLFSFIADSPTPFHAVDNIVKILQDSGFTLLGEDQQWDLQGGGKYTVIRNGSLIAFTIGEAASLKKGFRIIGAHTDSPSLQLKPHPKSASSPYFQFGVEKYGGALLATWFDRELSLAGRVTVITEKGEPYSCLIDFKEPVLYIPSLAIHLDRTANDGREINAQKDINPIFAQNITGEVQWLSLLLDRVNCQYSGLSARSILGSDLFCYDCSPPRFFGMDREFICGPRLDNLVSCFIGLEAIRQRRSKANCMLMFTNHEEIGSTSSSGALSNFGTTVLSRICNSPQTLAICMKRSFFLSLDNAHASHPNFADNNDSDHKVILNKGVVIKINSSQRYCSNSRSVALFRMLCSEAGVETQDFVMRSDLLCGSTIGPLTTAGLGIEGVDAGVPSWAMHSIREVTGTRDPEMLNLAANHFFNRNVFPEITDI